MIIDLSNPAHGLILSLLFIVWGWVADMSWFKTNRFFPEVVFLAVWASLAVWCVYSTIVLVASYSPPPT